MCEMAVRIEDGIKSLDADNCEALRKFLTFLAADIDSHPDRIRVMSATQRARLRSLTRGIEVDLNQPLLDDCE
jgi:antitoxin PrlF